MHTLEKGQLAGTQHWGCTVDRVRGLRGGIEGVVAWSAQTQTLGASG